MYIVRINCVEAYNTSETFVMNYEPSDYEINMMIRQSAILRGGVYNVYVYKVDEKSITGFNHLDAPESKFFVRAVYDIKY